MKTLINFTGCEATSCNLDGAKGALSLCVNLLPQNDALSPMPPLSGDASAKPCIAATAADHFPDTANALQLVFGLQRAGSVAIDDKFQVPAAISSLPGSGQGASAPHPSTAAEFADCQSAAKQIALALEHAISTQAYAKGMIINPCLLRYALRMSDGSHLWVSAPVLMLPNVLPPRLSIASMEAADDGTSIISFSPSANPYFQLRCRVVAPIDASLVQAIAGVDIFATAGISTYDLDNISALGITDYDSMAQESSGSTHRGRSDYDPVVGHWSDANDQYRAHRLSEFGTLGNSWHLNPNPSLVLALACECKYYRIASLPIDQLLADNGYFDIPLQSTHPQAIAKLPQLDISQAPQLRHMPAMKISMGDITYYAGGKACLEQPQPLQALASARCEAEAAQPCVVAVFVRTADGTRCATRSVAQLPIDISGDNFPQYLYYPHKGAYKMAICSAGTWRELPMAPHPYLQGSYWMGSLDDPYAPKTLDQAQAAALAAEIASASLEIPTTNALICTRNEQPWRIVGEITVGAGGIMCLMPAMKAMSQGQFGQHPLYAFCGDGVWAVASNAASCHQINGDAAVSPDAIAAIGHEVAYATTSNVMLLSGSSASCLTDRMQATGAFDPSRLPFWSLIAYKAGVGDDFPSLSSLLPDCSLAYDSDHGVLMLSAPGQELQYIYSPSQKAWAMRLGDCCGVLATHPIVLDSNHQPCRISMARAIGDYMPGSASLIIYGSNDLWNWHLMANSDSGDAWDLQGEPVRYAIVIILSRGARVKALSISD